MFSSHRDLIYKNSALQDILVKLLFIEYRLTKKYPLDEKVMSDYISTNSRIHHRFRIYYKGGKVSQLCVSPLVTPKFNRQQVARNPHFGYCHSYLNVLYEIKISIKSDFVFQSTISQELIYFQLRSQIYPCSNFSTNIRGIVFPREGFYSVVKM